MRDIRWLVKPPESPSKRTRAALVGTPGRGAQVSHGAWCLSRRGSASAVQGLLPLHARTQLGVGVPAMRSYLRKYLRAIATSWPSLGWSVTSVPTMCAAVCARCFFA